MFLSIVSFDSCFLHTMLLSLTHPSFFTYDSHEYLLGAIDFVRICDGVVVNIVLLDAIVVVTESVLAFVPRTTPFFQCWGQFILFKRSQALVSCACPVCNCCNVHYLDFSALLFDFALTNSAQHTSLHSSSIMGRLGLHSQVLQQRSFKS